MKALVTAQGTATHETGLCDTCYLDPKNQAYAREMASRANDIDPQVAFEDCSGNEEVTCIICGKETKTYEFYLTLTGTGSDLESAWIDACEGFSLDPGIVPEDEFKLIEISSD